MPLLRRAIIVAKVQTMEVPVEETHPVGRSLCQVRIRTVSWRNLWNVSVATQISFGGAIPSKLYHELAFLGDDQSPWVFVPPAACEVFRSARHTTPLQTNTGDSKQTLSSIRSVSTAGSLPGILDVSRMKDTWTRTSINQSLSKLVRPRESSSTLFLSRDWTPSMAI